jgi:hypothetical protein
MAWQGESYGDEFLCAFNELCGRGMQKLFVKVSISLTLLQGHFISQFSQFLSGNTQSRLSILQACGMDPYSTVNPY